jgi:hypothetical protein
MTGDAAMTDKALVFEDFADKVGEVFPINEEGVPKIPLILQEAEPLNPSFGLPGTRPPFSLVFVAKDPRVLPQRLYRLEHEELGDLSIFLVPIAKDKDGVSYQAVFN